MFQKLVITVIIGISLLLVFLPGAACSSSRNFDRELASIVKRYRFSTIAWEFKTLLQSVRELTSKQNEESRDEVETVSEYLVLSQKINTLKSETRAGNKENRQSYEAELNRLEAQQAPLAKRVEVILRRQIKETLARQEIYHPLYPYLRWKANFPPLDFKLEKPPHLLVISPRERIDTIKTVLLSEDMSLADIEKIEAEVDKLNVSSLVAELGGLGATYPSLVTSNASLLFMLDTATHEWLHQYLAFTPLGFRYLLDLTGVSRNYEIATMNETAANIVSKEISTLVTKQYYSKAEISLPPATPASEFDREMREIRKAVDRYLAQGEIEPAEKFMEQKRQYLATQGYHLRKLNQAYFAFHGQYADVPAFESPIGLELKKLRSQSASLGDFLQTVAGMTSRQDLKLALKETPQQ